MKTPKRTCQDCLFFTSYSSADPDGRCGEGCGTYGTHTRGSESACNAFMLSSAAKSARRKRKNRIAQYKRTIASLMRKNDEACSILRTVQKIIEVALAKDTTDVEISFKWENSHGRKEATRKARLLRRAHRRACRAINAENAKQGNLLCTDAEQLETRKGN